MVDARRWTCQTYLEIEIISFHHDFVDDFIVNNRDSETFYRFRRMRISFTYLLNLCPVWLTKFKKEMAPFDKSAAKISSISSCPKLLHHLTCRLTTCLGFKLLQGDAAHFLHPIQSPKKHCLFWLQWLSISREKRFCLASKRVCGFICKWDAIERDFCKAIFVEKSLLR